MKYIGISTRMVYVINKRIIGLSFGKLQNNHKLQYENMNVKCDYKK